MITFLSVASKKEENDLMKESVREQAALRTDEMWKFHMFEQIPEAKTFLEDVPLLDIISWDVTMKDSVPSLEKIRKDYRQSYLMVVADGSISPMVYLRPGIMPSSLLLKPVSRENLVMVVNEMMDAFTEKFDSKDVPESFVIETREGKQYIPLNQIYYIEAREKKIFIRTKQEEYGFYDTIENMEKKLPENFLRCHRSYIVNMSKVTAVKVSQSLIEVQDDLQVPLSRSYKKTVKEYSRN